MKRPDIHRLYAIINRRFRLQRMQRIWYTFGISTETRILDVGGTRYIWSLLPQQPHLVLLNLNAPEQRDDDILDVIGDARKLPFKDNSFDLVFSNSLIDHLFTFEQQKLFADECRRVAKCYVVQSPNQRFLIEPHLLTPFIHWLPKRLRTALIRNFTLWGLITRPSKDQCAAFVDEVRMLTHREMEALFPEANIWTERVFGLAKSLTAVKR
jgi:hypothetical protein